MMRRATWMMAIVGMVAILAPAAHGETLADGWTFRRPIQFKQSLTDAPGENIAWVEFYANGTQQGDGADFRVTSADKVIMPSKVMQVSRDNDFVRIAFATKSDGPYYVWWGNPKAEKPAKDLDIKRGILLEVSRNTGPAGAGAAAVAALDSAIAPPMASFLMPELDLGYCPLGDERQVFMHYTGQFKIDRPITAQMAFTVNDMGALKIDGKEISRQIKQGLKGQVRDSVAVDLAVGWHTLEIRQINQNAGNIALALAWQRPGEKAFSAFPAAVFAPATHAVAGQLEKAGAMTGNGPVADISVEPTAEGFLPPSYYGQRYTFDAAFPPARGGGGGTVRWDFGDGQVANGAARVTHMYLMPGIYPVKVTFDTGGGNGPAATARVQVRDRLIEKFPRPPEDTAQVVRVTLHDMKPETLASDAAFRGMSFFETAGDQPGQLAWGHAWLSSKGGTVPDASIFEETFDLARLAIEKKDFKMAAEDFKLAAGKASAMEVRANLMRHEVMTLCDYVDDAPAAVAEAQDWQKKISAASKPQVATVQAALAYALIARGSAGDGKAAKAAVDAAASAAPVAAAPARGGGTGNPAADALNQREIRTGVLTRNVENYIRTKDLDTAASLLNQWELEFPDALWEGFTRTLRVKLAVAEGRNLVAARIAFAHARANPDGFYAAELLYRAAENLKLGGEQQQAKTVMDLLASKYPESPYARQAEQ